MKITAKSNTRASLLTITLGTIAADPPAERPTHCETCNGTGTAFSQAFTPRKCEDCHGKGIAERPTPSCPICGSPEVEAETPRTVYACGSSDYDQRPGTLKAKCDRPTPITDAASKWGDWQGYEIVPSDVSRDIERQLADYKEALEITNRSADDQMFQKREAERQRDRLAKCLKDSNALALAWRAYYATSPTYGNGTEHPLHIQVTEDAKNALSAVEGGES